MSDTSGQNGLWKIPVKNVPGAKQIFSGVAEHPRWSPDGQLIVFDADTGKSIKMIPAEGGDPIAFLPETIHIRNGGLPCWSPDGTQIVFASTLGGDDREIYIMNADGSNLIPLTQNTAEDNHPSWSPLSDISSD